MGEKNTEAVVPKLTKTGQKPRTLTPEHLEKLKIAREKARITQIKNTELRKLERENKLHEKEQREKEIVQENKKNKEVRLSAIAPEPLEEDGIEEKNDLSDEEEEEQIVIKKTHKKKIAY